MISQYRVYFVFSPDSAATAPNLQASKHQLCRLDISTHLARIVATTLRGYRIQTGPGRRRLKHPSTHWPKTVGTPLLLAP